MTGKNATERLVWNAEGITRSAALLREGGLVAVPTETVYGLAARADDPQAVARIYDAKGRPSFNPLIVHVADVAHAKTLADWDERAELLAERFWPGPLTIVLPLRKGAGLAAAVTAGLDTIALRCPAHPAMRAVIEQSGLPLAAPSANRSGWVSPTTPEHVLETLDGRIDAVLDAGSCTRGLESSIVALRNLNDGGQGGAAGWAMLRPGPVSEEEIAAVLGAPAEVASGRIEAPGQLASHYAPGKPVRLDAEGAEADEFLIGFGKVAGDCMLSTKGDLKEAAANLYHCLHLGAADAKPRIAIAPIPREGIGIAINDRLKRAAA
ncbi:L-threonylcarbamoyladenylate synthase [Altererythrobacter sp.]|uniref:L-threonylcarbamoyladenylate synthase n=1 Tax=Altererythrobacter sp. TaxID=1872480 RepID=UPI003D02EE1D